MKKLAEEVIPHINSLGLNEQELFFLARCKEGRQLQNVCMSCYNPGPHQTIVRQPVNIPDIEIVSDILHWVLHTFVAWSYCRFFTASDLFRLQAN